MDVTTAYLNSDLEEKVYMEVPEQLREVIEKIRMNKQVGSCVEITREKVAKETANHWHSELNAKNDSVCLLKKSLYGLRQSGLQWHRKLVDKLGKLGFNALSEDPCMLISQNEDSVMIIAVYVDDLLIATNNTEWMSDVKQSLSESFEIGKDFGKANRCLGIEFFYDKNYRVCLKQKHYIEAILERYGMEECKPVSTPIESNCKLSTPENANESEMRKYPYKNLVGALMYLAVTTRPDIAYPVNHLSQFNSDYSIEHWTALKRVLRYLRGTTEYGLMYEKTGLPLFGVVDADWGANVDDRRPYSGYAFILGGSVISWEAGKQRRVALSTTEAEYMSLGEATKEALCLQSILNSIGLFGENECVVLFNDNQGAQKLVENNRYHSKN